MSNAMFEAQHAPRVEIDVDAHVVKVDGAYFPWFLREGGVRLEAGANAVPVVSFDVIAASVTWTKDGVTAAIGGSDE